MVHISALRYLLRYHGSAGDCAASADAHSVRFMIPRVGESDSRLIAHCHLPPCWQSATDRGVSRAVRRFGIAGSALAMGSVVASFSIALSNHSASMLTETRQRLRIDEVINCCVSARVKAWV